METHSGDKFAAELAREMFLLDQQSTRAASVCRTDPRPAADDARKLVAFVIYQIGEPIATVRFTLRLTPLVSKPVIPPGVSCEVRQGYIIRVHF